MSRNLTDALSKLFIKLGGKTSDSKENKGPIDYIDDITDIVKPGGGGGESGIFLVLITLNADDSSVTFDKNFSDIAQALSEGKIVIGKFIDDNERPYYSFVYGKEEDGWFSFKFETSVSYEFENDTLYYYVSIIDTSITSSNETTAGGLNATFTGSGDIW